MKQDEPTFADSPAADDIVSRLVKLCKTAEVEEGAPLAIYRDDCVPLAVFQVGKDYFVTDNTCTHGDSTLTDGYQDGNVIACSLHGGSFDITSGAPASLPCRKALRCHRVTLEGDTIFIALPQE